MTNPSDYERHSRGDGKRFHVRVLSGRWQVYAMGVEHICECDNSDKADMIAEALEAQADLDELPRGMFDAALRCALNNDSLEKGAEVVRELWPEK